MLANHLRLFCALPVPRTVQDELVDSANSLRGAMAPASASWVQAGNFHLTLRFLGDVEQIRVDELAAQLSAACQNVNRFELICQELGCFPNANRPRVIWAGLKGAGLSPLQNRVAAACAPVAEREEIGRFNAHITLGRIRPEGSPPNLSQEIERSRNVIFGCWEVREVELICSDLSQGAPRYSVLHRAFLAPGL